MAMISGAASGSWAMGEPHSEQKTRCTALPELPTPAQLLVGPLTVSLSLGTTATRAATLLTCISLRGGLGGGGSTVGRAALALAVVTVVVGDNGGLVDVDGVGDGLAQAVSAENHGGQIYRSRSR